MKLFSIFFLSIFLNISYCYEEKDELIVKINDGEIMGRYTTSLSGRTISAFIGIPFAMPPVGELRFKAPQKIMPWNGTLYAQTESPKCPQIDSFRGSTVFEGVEDCLYLNIYIPEKSTNDQLDVLVWLHGGGFVLDHGGPSYYGPDYLLDHDVILVTGNYRLGPLGFLSTEDENCPGNFGLKDQAFLLQWVQDNIEYFGGNKNSVTIWGESAGAVSVNFHMISSMSRGLFHKAISNSGRPAETARSGVAQRQAIRLAELMNCPITDNNEEIINCLRNVSAEDMIAVYVRSSDVSFPVVVVESFESDDDAFISKRNFHDLFSNSVEIPWLLGINSDEGWLVGEGGLLTMGAILSNSLLLDNLISTWNVVLPNSFGYGHLSADAQEEITNKINVFYFGNETDPTRQLDKNSLVNLFTDRYLANVETIQHRLSYNNHQSTYLYLYTHKGTSSFSTATEYYGTSHADDLIPLFPFRKTAFYSAIPTEQDNELTKVMTLMWTNFARTGNPTPGNTVTPAWPLVTNFPLNYMQIGNENGKLDKLILQPRVDFFSARANFWIELRKDYGINTWFEGSSSTSWRNSLFVFAFVLIVQYFLNY